MPMWVLEGFIDFKITVFYPQTHVYIYGTILKVESFAVN